MRWLLALIFVLASVCGVRAAEGVDLALVLVTDVSRSVHDAEFELMKQGYAFAFNDPDVLKAIKGGAIGRIAVNYVEFAGAHEVRTVVKWMVISDAASALAFTKKMQAAPRSFWGRTSISAGMELAMRNLAASGFEAQRQVIDVCGDGTNNAGRDVSEVRDEAIAAGITINGLAIINERPTSWALAHTQPEGGLDNWYRENVTGGPGSFVLTIRDFRSFGEAMRKKLLSEIAALEMPARL
jgi:hypothetical protein